MSVFEQVAGQSTSSELRLLGGVLCLVGCFGVRALSFFVSSFSLTSLKAKGLMLDCDAEVVMMVVVSRMALEYALCTFSFCMMYLVLSIRPLKAV